MSQRLSTDWAWSTAVSEQHMCPHNAHTLHDYSGMGPHEFDEHRDNWHCTPLNAQFPVRLRRTGGVR
jgi:hypothetical protein